MHRIFFKKKGSHKILIKRGTAQSGDVDTYSDPQMEQIWLKRLRGITNYELKGAVSRGFCSRLQH